MQLFLKQCFSIRGLTPYRVYTIEESDDNSVSVYTLQFRYNASVREMKLRVAFICLDKPHDRPTPIATYICTPPYIYTYSI